MDENAYSMLFKRKSFHRFPGAGPLSEQEIAEIERQFERLLPLADGIRTALRLVPKAQTTCARGEYCVLIYSERKPHYLTNAGYLGEQLDLWLASKNIGACWYGMGKPAEETYQGLEFVVMLAVGKAAEQDFRKDYTKAKRKELSEFWRGGLCLEAARTARYAPSACNSQPWLVECEGNKLFLYRVRGKRGIMPAKKVSYYNQIDMGIFILFLELSLHNLYSLRPGEGAFRFELSPGTQGCGERELIAVFTVEAPSPPA